MEKDKAIKKLGEDTVMEMEAMTQEDLKKTIVESQAAMRTAKEELEANPKYQELKASLQDVSQAKKDVDSRQKARTAYALELLEQIGKLDAMGVMEWENSRLERAAALKKKSEEK
jgi:hypothetical protein